MVEIVWLNGRLLPAQAAMIPVADRGFTLGDGIFETLRLSGGVAPDAAAHFARLAAGATLLWLGLPFDAGGMAEILAQTAAANGIMEGGARLTLTRGAGPRGLLPPAEPSPTVLATAFALPGPGQVKAVICRSIARDETSPLSQVKTLNYLPHILARQEAEAAGAQEAILLNRAGRVACASIGNLLVKSAGVWLTPPVAEAALPGIRRARLLAEGAVAEAVISVEMLRAAQALAVCNVLALRPILSLDGAALPAVETP